MYKKYYNADNQYTRCLFLSIQIILFETRLYKLSDEKRTRFSNVPIVQVQVQLCGAEKM